MKPDCPRCKNNDWNWATDTIVDVDRVYIQTSCRACGLDFIETFVSHGTHYEDHGTLYDEGDSNESQSA